MEIKPVKEGKKPKYPTLEFFAKNPRLLSGNVPERWIGNKLVATSLATFVLLGNPKSVRMDTSPGIAFFDRTSDEDEHQTFENKKSVVKVAPIFVHGDGSGSTGCIVMSPPVFISESEAKKIIFDALSAEGIQMSTENCPVIQVNHSVFEFNFSDGSSKESVERVALRMDGYNEELNLAIQFVSADDHEKLKPDLGFYSSVQSYDTRETAELIRKELQDSSTVNSGIFYDPMPSIELMEEDYEKNKLESQREAEELLLAQVKDFIKWMRRKNIVPK